MSARGELWEFTYYWFTVRVVVPKDSSFTDIVAVATEAAEEKARAAGWKEWDRRPKAVKRDDDDLHVAERVAGGVAWT